MKLVNEGVAALPAGQGHLLNSPWNIAAPFMVDMSFGPEDIAGMLREYEADSNTGMDIPLIANEIYEYTAGYPFLVSHICYMLDKDKALLNDWTPRGVRNAVQALVNQNPLNTLFDDISKNLEIP